MNKKDFAVKMHGRGTWIIPSYDRRPVLQYAHFRLDGQHPELSVIESAWERNPDAECTVMCGTGGLVCLDVDLKNDPTGTVVARWESDLKSAHPGLFEDLFIEQTQSGGRHYWFLLPEGSLETSTDLAFMEQERDFMDIVEEKPAKFKPVIEFKATTPCRISPTDGFIRIQGDETHVKRVSVRDLEIMFEIGRSFNEKPEVEKIAYTVPTRIAGDGVKPGDDYASSVSIDDVILLFEAAGWTEVKRSAGRVLLRRPGARTKNHDADLLVSKRAFMCYSSSVSEFETGKGYSFFAVYATLQHGGDFVAAAKDLAAQGWGDAAMATSAPSVREYSGTGTAPTTTTEVIEKPGLESFRVRLTDEFEEQPPLIEWLERRRTPYGEDRRYFLSAAGMIGIIGGPAKARKSAILAAIEAAALDGEEHCGFCVDLPEGEIIHIDTEQAEFWAKKSLMRLAKQSGSDVPERYAYYCLRRLSPRDRLVKLGEIALAHPNAVLIGIDGLKDMAEDFVKDNQEADRIIAELMRISSVMPKKPMIIGIIHVNPGTDKLRGTLGTEATNKADWALRANLSEEDEMATDIRFTECRDMKPKPFTAVADDNNILEAYRDAKHRRENATFRDESPLETFQGESYPRDESNFLL